MTRRQLVLLAELLREAAGHVREMAGIGMGGSPSDEPWMAEIRARYRTVALQNAIGSDTLEQLAASVSAERLADHSFRGSVRWNLLEIYRLYLLGARGGAVCAEKRLREKLGALSKRFNWATDWTHLDHQEGINNLLATAVISMGRILELVDSLDGTGAEAVPVDSSAVVRAAPPSRQPEELLQHTQAYLLRSAAYGRQISRQPADGATLFAMEADSVAAELVGLLSPDRPLIGRIVHSLSWAMELWRLSAIGFAAGIGNLLEPLPPRYEPALIGDRLIANALDEANQLTRILSVATLSLREGIELLVTVQCTFLERSEFTVP